MQTGGDQSCCNERKDGLRIAHFVDTMVVGGAETMLLNLIRYQRSLGAEVWLLCFNSPRLLELAAELSIPYKVLPHHEIYKRKSTLLKFCCYFRRYLQEQHFDILHTHLLGASIAGGITTIASGICHLGTMHDTYTLFEKRSLLMALRMTTWTGSSLVSVSPTIHSCLVELGGFRKSNLYLIPNGVDVPEHTTPDGPGDVRGELGIAESDYVFICVARLTELKAHEVIFKALQRLESLPFLKLLIVGCGARETELKRLVNDLGLSELVLFLGERSDVPSLLRAADCFVLSSTTEGLSCSILESMAAGLPAVVTDVGGNSYLVEEGVSGFLVARGDSEAFAQRMRALATDRELGQRMGQSAYHRVKKDFTLESMASRYLELYSCKQA